MENGLQSPLNERYRLVSIADDLAGKMRQMKVPGALPSVLKIWWLFVSPLAFLFAGRILWEAVRSQFILPRMKLAVGWLLFGVPLVAAVVAGIGLYRNWSNEHHQLIKVLAVAVAISAALLGFGTTAYVQLVRPLPAFDFSVEETGLLLSLVGTVLGLITLRFPRWFSSLALGVSSWMLVWFFLLGSSY